MKTVKDFNNIPPSGQKPDNDLSSLVDSLLHLEDYLRCELLRVKRLRQMAERQIPDSYNNLFNQINELLKD